MRERRWETTNPLTFHQVLAVGERLAALGLKPSAPPQDVICYVEEWTVAAPDEFDQLDPWATEDVTLVHVREGWRGDFFLLAGAMDTFVYLKPGVAIILVFVGIKMVASRWLHLPILLSLGVIVGVLAIAVTLSLRKARREAMVATVRLP